MKIRWNRAVLIAVAGLLAVTALAVARSTTVGVATAEVKAHKEPVAVNSTRRDGLRADARRAPDHLVVHSPSRACLGVWPPVRASGVLTKAAGVTGGKLGTR